GAGGVDRGARRVGGVARERRGRGARRGRPVGVRPGGGHLPGRARAGAGRRGPCAGPAGRCGRVGGRRSRGVRRRTLSRGRGAGAALDRSHGTWRGPGHRRSGRGVDGQRGARRGGPACAASRVRSAGSVLRPASLLPLAVLGVSLVACKGEVPVPGKERVGTYLLQSVGDPLFNDCPGAIFDAGVDAGAPGGVFVDAGVIFSVTFHQTTAPDGGPRFPDGGLVTPYDAGYLTFIEGSGSQYGVINGQVIDTTGVAPRVFAACGCTGLAPPDIQVVERNQIALLS